MNSLKVIFIFSFKFLKYLIVLLLLLYFTQKTCSVYSSNKQVENKARLKYFCEN